MQRARRLPAGRNSGARSACVVLQPCSGLLAGPPTGGLYCKFIISNQRLRTALRRPRRRLMSSIVLANLRGGQGGGGEEVRACRPREHAHCEGQHDEQAQRSRRDGVLAHVRIRITLRVLVVLVVGKG